MAAWVAASILLLAAVFVHWLLWRLARSEGRPMLGWVVVGLGAASLASLVVLGTLSPLVALARLAVTLI